MDTPIDQQVDARKLTDVKLVIERGPQDANGWTTCRCTGLRFGYSDGSAELEHEALSEARIQEIQHSMPLPPITLDNAYEIQL